MVGTEGTVDGTEDTVDGTEDTVDGTEGKYGTSTTEDIWKVVTGVVQSDDKMGHRRMPYQQVNSHWS